MSLDAPLALPAPPVEGDSNTPQLSVDSGDSIRFDALGPMVVNSDGVRENVAPFLSARLLTLLSL